MKSTVEKIGSLQRRLNIQVPADKVMSAYEQTLKGVQKQAAIKGFRQGKAPLSTIKSVYGDRVKQDVVQEIIQKHYFEALKEHKLDPISYPEFEFDQLSEGKDFSFTANFEVKPEVTLKKYEGVDIEKEKFVVGDEQVNNVLENIRAARAELVDVLEIRPAKMGDVAIVDFEGFIEGKPLPNGSGTNHNLELGANQFIEGFEEGLVGMKVGDKKTLNLKFPNPYHSAEIAGKPVDFNVELKGLKYKKLPELNDEYVTQMMGQSMGGPASEGVTTHTVESLKTTIREDLEQSEKKRIETDMKNRLLKKLVSLNPVDVPPSMLQDQKKALIEDMKKKMSEQGMSDSEFQIYTEKWDKDFENSAAEMIQSGFLIDAIAGKHDLKWNDEDLDKKFEEYASTTGIDKVRIKEFYSRPEQMNRVTYAITEDKVIAFLMNSAKVKEVSKDQLKETLS